MTTPTEALKIARDALADMIRAGKQAKVDLTTGIRDGEPVHPVSASLTFPLATAINAIAAIDALAQPQPSAPSVEPVADLRKKLIDAIAAGLGGTYHCTRVWSAWHVGTMSQDDFSPVDESDTPAELADAVLSIIGAAPQAAPLAPEPVEHVAEVMSGWVLAWAGQEPIAHLLARHPGVRIGSKLYATPPAAPAPTVQPLTDLEAREVAGLVPRLPWGIGSRWVDVLAFARAIEANRAAAWGITLAGITAAPTKE